MAAMEAASLAVTEVWNMTFPDWVKRGEKFKAYGYIWEVLRIHPLVQARRWKKHGWYYRYFREWQFERDVKRVRV
jgi:hypothetical protein